MKNIIDDLPQFDTTIFIEKYKTKEDQQQSISYYQRGNMIGRGSFSQLYEIRKYYGAFQKYLGEELMIKIMSKQFKTEQKQSLYENQVKISKLINNQRSKKLLNYVTNWQDNKNFYIIYQKPKLGSLYLLVHQMYNRDYCFSQLELLYFAQEILKAIQSLHKLKIIHRDIKMQNILMNQLFELKISDYGFAKTSFSQLEPKDSNIIGTPRYMAPQIMEMILENKKNVYSYEVDIWSFGILLYYLIYKRYPFQDINQEDYYQNIIKKDIPFQQIKDYQKIIKLLKNILIKQPSKRPSSTQILNDNLFKKKDMNIKEAIQKKFKKYIQQKTDITKLWTKEIDKNPLIIKQDTRNKIERKSKKVSIIKVHYDKKFGYFCLLSNFTFCAYFNDGKILKYYKNSSGKDEDEDKKFAVMRCIYLKQFKLFCQNNKKHYHEQLLQQPNCNIFKFSKIKNTIFIRLTNDVLQMFIGQEEKENIKYEKYIQINSNMNDKQSILFYEKGQEILYENYNKALDSYHKKSFEFMKSVMQVMINNSMISSQKLNLQ